MEWLRLIRGINFNLVKGSKDFIIDWSPPVVLNSFIPSLMLVALGFIILDVDRLTFLVLFHLIIVPRGERVDVTNSAMHEYLVIYQRWEFQPSESKPHVALRCRV